MSKIKSFALILGVLIMSFLIGYLVLAWVEPTATPPGGNVYVPLNVSGTGQTKTGSLSFPIFYDTVTDYWVDPAGGTANYSAKLKGGIWIGNVAPTTNDEGAMYYDSSNHVFKCYQGSPTPSWGNCGGGSVSWPLRGPDQDSSAPTYSFTNSTGSGMFFNSAPLNKTLNFSVGGTTRMVIDSYGKVGIGKNPSTSIVLDVLNPSGFSLLGPVVSVVNESNLASNNGLFVNIARTSPNTDAYALDVQSGGTSRFYVRSDGNVGIGTTTPNQKLSIAGTLGILEGGASPTNYTIFQGGVQSADITYTLPISSANGCLTNTAGTLTWGACGGGGAPTDATYITQTVNAALTAEQALSTLATGYMKVTNGTGVVSSITTIPATEGGTGRTTYTTGDILYASAANTLANRAIGSAGQVLTVSGGVPVWAAAGGGVACPLQASCDGTAVAPAYSFASVTNMGMYRDTANDRLSFATAGTERLTINASGDIGIGAAPQSVAKLYVSDTSGVAQKYGLWFYVNGTTLNGRGIYGRVLPSSGTGYGVYGDVSGAAGTTNAFGLFGTASGALNNRGASGQAASAAGATAYGLYGNASGAGTNWGLWVNAGNAYIADSLGIGTAPGSYKLYVNGAIGGDDLVINNSILAVSGPLEVGPSGIKVPQGAICVDSDGTCNPSALPTGQISARGYSTGGSDVAEMVKIGMDKIEAGDVVTIDSENDYQITLSDKPYDTRVAGVISTAPGVILGSKDDELGAKPLAVTGIVPTKVTTINGPIKRGDLLTTSSMPGYAMKVSEYKIGTIVGKALESLESGEGKINVLITLQ